MDRMGFLKRGGLACIGGAGITALLQSCGGTRLLSGKIAGDNLIVNTGDFEMRNGNEIYFKKYIVVENEILQYLVCVYRFNEKGIPFCG